jgi:hypothetical protein
MRATRQGKVVLKSTKKKGNETQRPDESPHTLY